MIRLLPLFSNRRQLQLLAQDIGQLVERDVHFEHVIAGVFAGLAGAVLLVLAGLAADRVASVSFTLTDAALLLVPEGEARDVDLRDRIETRSFPLRPSISPCEM